MKRSLLLVLVLIAFAMGAMAQDIYTIGVDGNSAIATTHFQKNGVDINSYEFNGDKYNVVFRSMVIGDDGCVYYVSKINVSYENISNIYKYDPVSGQTTIVYEAPMPAVGDWTVDFYNVNDIVWHEGHLYAAGVVRRKIYETKDYSYWVSLGFILKDGEMLYGPDNYEEEAVLKNYYSRIVVDPLGQTWIVSLGDLLKNNETYDFGYSHFIKDVVYYNNFLYLISNDSEAGSRISRHRIITGGWGDDEDLYVWPSDAGVTLNRLVEADGNLFVLGSDSDSYKVWKYNIQTQECSEAFTLGSRVDFYYEESQMVADHRGLYFVNPHFMPKKYTNGTLSQINLTYGALTGVFLPSSIAVTYTPPTPQTYNLPFEEEFEYGSTKWDEWVKVDVDNQNYSFNSYWARFDNNNDIDDLGVRHMYDLLERQEGWLISPAISLPDNEDAKLSFYCVNHDWDYYKYNGVYVMVRPNSSFVLTESNFSPDYFTEIWINDPKDGNWHSWELDLSDYKGQTVYIAFKYAGPDGDEWIVDDFKVGVSNNSTNESIADQAFIWPNPAKEKIHLESLEADSEVSIYDAMGALVKVVRLGVKKDIKIDDLSAGLYFIKSGTYNSRFVKE